MGNILFSLASVLLFPPEAWFIGDLLALVGFLLIVLALYIFQNGLPQFWSPDLA